MKEKIYTIPINDVFNTDSECPICRFAEKEENDKIDYTLGDSMMQPDERILSNKKGYCGRHTQMLLNSTNKLSFALILETRLDYIQNLLSDIKIEKPKKIFSKKDEKNQMSSFKEQINDCVICDKLSNIMDIFMDNLFYMYKNDELFRKKFFSSKGFCVHHFISLIESAQKFLSPDDFTDFLQKLIKIERENIVRVQNDISWFTKKFDYRYKDEDWKDSRDAVERACEKTAMYMKKD